MNNLMKKIKNDAQKAMKSGEKDLSDSLKYLYSLLQAEEARGSDFDGLKVLQKELKNKKEALKMFKKGGRQDLADKEKKDIKILQRYLPEMLSEKEIENIVSDVADKVDQPDFGKIMGQVMSKVKGRADGSKVSKVVKRHLNSQ
jgi:uncharacterized protein